MTAWPNSSVWVQLAAAEHQRLTPVIETSRALLVGTELGHNGWRATGWCLAIVAVAIPTSATLYRRRTSR